MVRETCFRLPEHYQKQAIWLSALIIGALSLLILAPINARAGAIEDYLTEQDFKTLFPHANEVRPVTADPHFYSYANMVDGLKLKQEFAPFLSEDDTTNRLELAAILANWAQETTGGWDTAPEPYTNYGLSFMEENGARAVANPDPKNCCCYFDRENEYQPAAIPTADTCFFGRGPIQLSWNANYARFSEFLLGDSKILLNNPDELLKDGKNGFASGYWFWVLYDTSRYMPGKTCHQAMVEGKAEGFGTVINIVNGGIECNHELYPWEPTAEFEPDPEERKRKRLLGRKIRHRADHFHRFADYLGVGDQLPARPAGEPNGNPEWDEYYKKMLVGCIK